MRVERHNEILKEVLDEVEAALKDERGLVAHQRRLAFSLSLGSVNLLEMYLHKLGIIKEGSKIDHRLFGKRKENILEHLQNQITSPVDSVDNIGGVVDIMVKIEEKRNDIAYGAPATEKVLQEKINLFFELRRVTGC
ncbi:hypothetical protein HYU15_03440 [Candidatus Woesearchaeota archaeon]|nr:hypothetical protein [Candidatus Woesearchaeota archaeon]